MAAESVKSVESSGSFSEAILGNNLRTRLDELFTHFFGSDGSWRVGALIAAFAALVFVPYLGAVGLWDPWETHYGEVARSMIQRNDYVYPYWESSWFFSKPVFTMWMTAAGMQLVGTNRTDGSLAVLTEWGMRLPIVLLSIAAVMLMSVALTRVVNKRVGLAFGFVLVTMPLYFLITRQAVTDTPFIATMIAALACAIIGQFDDRTPHSSGWWYAFYLFCAVSTLAKGLLGFGLPAVVLLVYAIFSVIPWDEKSIENHLSWISSVRFRADCRAGIRPMPVLWAQCHKMRLGTGVLIFIAATVPWYAVMFVFPGFDDEGKVFWFRFLIHDHLNRLAAGVHATSSGGFTYFIEQGGFAIFPWVALAPGAMSVISRLRLRSSDKRDHVAVIATIWVVLSFILMGSSATKFHHYVLPILPGLAILMALFIDNLWEQGVARHSGSLMVGFALFVLVAKDLASNPKNFTDLFVYNYDRPYPFELIQRQVNFLGVPWTMGHLIVFTLILLGLYLCFDSFLRTKGSVYSRAVSVAILATGVSCAIGFSASPRQFALIGFVGVGLAIACLYLVVRPVSVGLPLLIVALVSAMFVVLGFRTPLTMDPLSDSFRQIVNIKVALGFAFAVAGGILLIAALQQARLMLFGSFWALACVFTLWFCWDHWVDLSHHWTQRDQFKLYYKERKADEPIAAFLMNWRGETFYSKNSVKQIKDNNRLAQYANLPGRKWALVEHNRFSILRSAVGADKNVTVVDKDMNNKFMLVTIE